MKAGNGERRKEGRWRGEGDRKIAKDADGLGELSEEYNTGAKGDY